ncbi:MAG: AAA family ATPase [Phycisphaerales bacterium]|nr:AAA family ATPase [Phycisphaerales bacterium]
MSIESLNALRENIQKVFIGHPDSADRLLVCLLARGHALIEDVPGVGKTLMATALARSIDCAFSRIQLTPDLLPADVLGVSIYDRERSEFRFNKGPIFANIVLADEINRTTPRTQSALLEAMSDGAVSVDGKTMKLEQPFMVVATQNPYEFEGTYYLPENQLDRFLMRIDVGYPSPEDEARIINLRPADTMLEGLKATMHPRDVVALQKEVDQVKLHDDLVQYIIRIAGATRQSEELEVGLSPRGSLALAQAARATALLGGRDYTIPEDITDNAVAVCAHRVVSRAFMQSGDSSISRQIMQRIMERVPSPA